MLRFTDGEDFDTDGELRIEARRDGLYVLGGGMMIHAPHTGAVVRIDPLHSNYAGACRP